MKHQLKKLQSGFTIIEVLIVLAIAGLIMAIVFLAVPALQRNSRNTSIKSDASAILAGVNDYIANNQGQLPTTVVCNNGTVAITGTGSASEAKVKGGTTCNAAGTMPATNTLGVVSVALNRKCNGNSFATATANHSVSAGFRIENTGSTDATQCIES